MYPHIPKFILPVHSLLLDLQIQLPAVKCMSVSVKHSTCPANSLLQTSPQLHPSYYWSWMSFLSSVWIFTTSEQRPTNWFCGKSETQLQASFGHDRELLCLHPCTSIHTNFRHHFLITFSPGCQQAGLFTNMDSHTHKLYAIDHPCPECFNTHFHPFL